MIPHPAMGWSEPCVFLDQPLRNSSVCFHFHPLYVNHSARPQFPVTNGTQFVFIMCLDLFCSKGMTSRRTRLIRGHGFLTLWAVPYLEGSEDPLAPVVVLVKQSVWRLDAAFPSDDTITPWQTPENPAL